MIIKILKPKLKRLQAFSLTELAVSIIIVGVIITGILAAESVITKARISNARSLTSASSINTMKGLSLWLETTLEGSINSSEADVGKSISTWYDNNVTAVKNNAVQTSDVNKPAYSNGINRIHSVSFDGTNSYFTVDGSFLNNKNYTIFVMEKRLSNKADNYFIGDSSITTANQNLLLGYSADIKLCMLKEPAMLIPPIS